MSNKNLIIGVVIILAFGGVYYFQQDNLQTHQKECGTKLSQFQSEVIAENKNGSANATDFLVAYSQKLNTCIGGYTTPVELLSTPGTYLYTYSIRDLNTNAEVDSFSTFSEEVRPDFVKTYSAADEGGKIAVASQIAWQKYKDRLSELSNGQIKLQ